MNLIPTELKVFLREYKLIMWIGRAQLEFNLEWSRTSFPGHASMVSQRLEPPNNQQCGVLVMFILAVSHF